MARVIQVLPKDCDDLLERLELIKFRKQEFATVDQKKVADEMHRAFHYEVVSWLQKHGV